MAGYLWAARQAGTGLLYGLADVPEGDPFYGYDLGVAADTASNVLAGERLLRIAQLADLAGDSTGAALQRSRAAQLTAAVNGLLVRPDGVYVDGIDSDGTQSTHASQEANALALAYGVVPAANVARVGAFVASLGIDVGPNHGLELLRGLAAGRSLRRHGAPVDGRVDPGWAQILAEGGTFTWETWKPSDLVGDSMSHGWGSSALVAMQESLLGVSFDTPDPDGTVRRGGGATVGPDCRGRPGQRADGRWDPLAVSWVRSGRGVALELDVPVNATVRVMLPASSAPRGARGRGRRGVGARRRRTQSVANGRPVGGRRAGPTGSRVREVGAWSGLRSRSPGPPSARRAARAPAEPWNGASP